MVKDKSKEKFGRPKIDKELITLIQQIANENPFWRAPRIHSEIKKLGFDVSESTVQRDTYSKETMVQRIRNGKLS